MKNVKFIAVSGFFSSGSSAVVDLLKEYKGTYECEAEIRIIKDPYGLSQLEQALTDHWDLLNSAAAIRDYLWLCKICNRSNSNPFSPVGLSYAKKITPQFMSISKQFIDDITDFTYKSDFFYQKFKKNYIQCVMDRWRMGAEFYSHGKLPLANRNGELSHFSHPTKEEFQKAASEYLVRLFENCITDQNEGYVILDQAVSTNDTEPIHKYLGDAKMIIVDRDPRDMYVEDLVRWRENLDKDVSSKEAGLHYVMRHRALRENIPVDDDSIMTVKFEDLVLDYEYTKTRIEQFVQFDRSNHIRPYTFLIPEKSARNIGIWKQYYGQFQDAIDAIKENLEDYCYEGE